MIQFDEHIFSEGLVQPPTIDKFWFSMLGDTLDRAVFVTLSWRNNFGDFEDKNVNWMGLCTIYQNTYTTLRIHVWYI